MLLNTFIHLPGIGSKKEREFWRAGIRTWDDYERVFLNQPSLFPDERLPKYFEIIEKSREALQRGDTEFFAGKLPPGEHFRIALTFPEQIAFLDIETTGLSHYYDDVTLIGVSFQGSYYCHINGANENKVRSILREAKCIVTFNGARFDVKFLAARRPEISLPKAHIDLYWLAQRFGLRGGQKQIEADLGLYREAGLTGLSGEDAPLLWYEYRLGEVAAAQRLIEYNCADIGGMHFIFNEILARMLKGDSELHTIIGRAPEFQPIVKPIFAPSRKASGQGRIFVPPFGGRKGPQIALKQLMPKNQLDQLRIVGIDLTGSEKRPTGWSLLEGDVATTRLIRTDDELFNATLATNPTLISIDSPLSLPRGRKTVSDNDPGRKEFGIMRQCERELKRRGVNVYPSLLPSMQQLTARGIRLATRFRQAGYPVIESYPGAAQDIIGIPRKQKGLHHLKKALADFGIKGAYRNEDVSHDEVDAITSAIVGLFFWSGKFEPLGNDEEDFLIIPDLKRSPRDWRNRWVIGISGAIAAGKTTAGDYLKIKGFAYGRFSKVLSSILESQGKKVNRRTLQALGDRIHKNPGQRWLCKQLVKSLRDEKNIVIDGLRFPEDHAYLVETFGPIFLHVHVVAPPAIRRKRYVAMGNKAGEFDRAIRHHVEMGVPKLQQLADRTLENKGSRGGFHSRLGRVIMGNRRSR